MTLQFQMVHGLFFPSICVMDKTAHSAAQVAFETGTLVEGSLLFGVQGKDRVTPSLQVHDKNSKPECPCARINLAQSTEWVAEERQVN